ncbi:MAG: Fe-Mn family superoxide dismutase, partial [Dehalococcoidales bacterium]|nr:Fe-Mn family superoxide dismutase [Dehalococcoidales bacterium]
DVLYKGYVNKLNEIESKLPTANPAEANATYSSLRELKREEVFAADAARLHQKYFENLGGDGTAQGNILTMINEDFGSYENWETEFKAAGVAGRGWVILAFDWEDGRIHNYMTDIHSDGVWDCAALLILDVYEHSYFIDYGTNRKAYIDAFVKNVNWDIVNRRIDQYGIMARRGRGGPAMPGPMIR